MIIKTEQFDGIVRQLYGAQQNDRFKRHVCKIEIIRRHLPLGIKLKPIIASDQTDVLLYFRNTKALRCIEMTTHYHHFTYLVPIDKKTHVHCLVH